MKKFICVKLLLFSLIFHNVKAATTFTKPEDASSMPVFNEEYFDQYIDHFNFNSQGDNRYPQRYLITSELPFLFSYIQCFYKEVNL